MQVGLFFGSFNPIHIGHLAIANYMVSFTDLDEVWFVISPLNPFKKKAKLLAEYHRFELVSRAIEQDDRLNASNIEFNLPKPSFTIDTIAYLKEKHPNVDFTLIMGADQLPSLHKWKNPDQLIKEVNFMVYPRPGFDHHPLSDQAEFTCVDAPLLEISASFIRKAIANGKDVRHFLHAKVWEYVEEMNFYK